MTLERCPFWRISRSFRAILVLGLKSAGFPATRSVALQQILVAILQKVLRVHYSEISFRANFAYTGILFNFVLTTLACNSFESVFSGKSHDVSAAARHHFAH